MKDFRITSKIWLLAAFLFFGMATLMIGTAYGRYQDTYYQPYTISVRGASVFLIQGEDGQSLSGHDWAWEDGKQMLSFQVSNQANEADAYFNLSLVTTLGAEIDEAVVALQVTNMNGGVVLYQGVATKLTEDEVLYQEMGPGSRYRFYDQNGNELCWELEGGQHATCEFTLVLEGAVTPGLAELIVTEQAAPDLW